MSGSHTTLAPHRSFCRSSQCEHPRCPLDRVMTVAAAGVRRSVAIKDRARAHAVISRGVLAVCGAAVPRSDRLQGGPVIPSTRLRDKSALHARRQQPRPEPPRLSVGRNHAPQRPETAFDAVLPITPGALGPLGLRRSSLERGPCVGCARSIGARRALRLRSQQSSPTRVGLPRAAVPRHTFRRSDRLWRETHRSNHQRAPPGTRYATAPDAKAAELCGAIGHG